VAIAHARIAGHDSPEPIELTPEVAAALIRLLHGARRAEIETAGPVRRRAFRNTRHLLGGMRALGVPSRFLADALDVTVRSVRTRAETDGLIRVDDFQSLSGLPVRVVGSANGAPQRAGWTDTDGEALHHASALIRAVLASVSPR
jgi:hypothetical protein